jgi:hypothetical protein
MLGQKDVPSVATIHHALRHIDSRSGYVCPVVNIGHLIDGPAVNTHA